jgi:hypothetical protein
MGVIALTGYKQSGKDTVGNYLVDNYGFVRYAFADPIREVCKIIFDWSDEYMCNHKEDIDEFWGISPRYAMQWIGTEGFQYYLPKDVPQFAETVGRTIWVRKFLSWHERTQNKDVVITDMRFHHELSMLKDHISNNLVSIRVNRDSVEPNDPHASEQDIPDLNVDWEVENDGTFEQLYEQIDFIMGVVFFSFSF